jgi:hypothetical protein
MFRASTISVPRQGKLSSSIAALDKCGVGSYPICALTSDLRRESPFEPLADRSSPAKGCGDIDEGFFALKAEDWCSSANREAAKRHDAVVSVVNESRGSETYHCYRNRAAVGATFGGLARLLTGSAGLPLVENWEIVAELGDQDAQPSVECMRYLAVHVVGSIGSILISAVASHAESAGGQLDGHVCVLIRHHPTSWIPTFHHGLMADFIMDQIKMCAQRFRTRVVDGVPATHLVSLREASATDSVLGRLMVDARLRRKPTSDADAETEEGSAFSPTAVSDSSADVQSSQSNIQPAASQRDEDLNDGLISTEAPRVSCTDALFRTNAICCA